MQINMDKNRLLGLVIIIAIFVLGAIYAFWLLVFNKGEVIFEGKPPFSVSIGGESHICMEMQCAYTLPAREYSYTISKDGYFDQSGSVSVKRGQRALVSYEAVFEAKSLTGVDYPMPELPIGYSKYQEKLLDISLFHMIQDGYQLQKMPKKINGMEFSPSGNDAILFEDGMVSHYSTGTFEKKIVSSLTGAYSASWNSNENAVYSIVYDEASKKDALIRVDLANGSTGKDVYFLRSVSKYSLSVSPDEKHVFLVDETSDIQTLYLIDREAKTRTNIFEGYAIQKGIWSGDGNYYIFSGKKNKSDAPSLWLFNAGEMLVEKLNFNALPRLVASAGEDKFYFVSTDEYALNGFTRPYFSDFEEIGGTLKIDDIAGEGLISLHMFSALEKQTYLVLDLTNSIPEMPKKIEINASGSILRMLAGNQYFDVKISE